LRSTIIGDCLSRVLEFLGHEVMRINHVGDWGTQFGMLIHYLKVNHPHALPMIGENAGEAEADLGADIGDLVEFYKAAKRRFDEDPVFKEAARAEVVRLQAGDPQSLLAWRAICRKSRAEFQQVYDRLGVRIEERGESFYNPLLPGLVAQLQESGAVVTSEGAQCIFLEGFKNMDDSPLPLVCAPAFVTFNFVAHSHFTLFAYFRFFRSRMAGTCTPPQTWRL
jgi:arginyl-tRNA synthetase